VRRHPRVAEALAEAQGFAGCTQAGIQQANTAKKKPPEESRGLKYSHEKQNL